MVDLILACCCDACEARRGTFDVYETQLKFICTQQLFVKAMFGFVAEGA